MDEQSSDETQDEKPDERPHENPEEKTGLTLLPSGKSTEFGDKFSKYITKQKAMKFAKKYWVPILLLVIFIMAYNMRLSGIVMPDGTYRWPYLRNIDSYALTREMQMILDNNWVMPAVDTLKLAPEGEIKNTQLYPYQYLGALSYSFLKLFDPGLQFWESMIYLPAILGALMVIPAYYIGKLLYDKKAGVIAAFLMVFVPAITARTLGGDPDTDAISMLLTLVSMAAFLVAYKSIGNKLTKKTVIYSILAGIVLAIYAYTWAGAWHIPVLILGFIILKIVLDFVMTKGSISERARHTVKANKLVVYSFVIILIAYSALIAPWFKLGFVVDTFTTPFQMLGFYGGGEFKTEEGRDVPNVYVSVAELQSGGSFSDVAQRVGTEFFILTFIFALPYLVLSYITTKRHLDTVLLIILWTVGPLIAAMAAIRFSSILAPPVVIGTSIILAKAWRLALGEDKAILE
ncbi:MAG: STT3 domain-containing protein [Candidatus Aenigmatarchaeota archaeon]